MKKLLPLFALLGPLTFSAANANEASNTIPMWQGNATTFYVQAEVGEMGAMDFMVDTGSGYMTINETTLAGLKESGQAEYQRELRGVLANGSEIVVPVYELAEMNIGNCRLTNVEAAVFPGKTRQILGLNALKQAGNFTFSFNPPQLALSGCQGAEILADASDQQQ
ncbi:TIGR02281 family clan AA aspartic protease [Motiliproteus sp. SC1-56]|uniref:retropepsin-like aspartic protease family protein n=1 Tax=Motiliproteus sp. SC1-56 TaxID=2799565 RepID=UPI001A8EE15B|nr:retropepsin-like aspartic protease [Motiliproteus sp. SC1-56]